MQKQKLRFVIFSLLLIANFGFAKSQHVHDFFSDSNSVNCEFCVFASQDFDLSATQVLNELSFEIDPLPVLFLNFVFPNPLRLEPLRGPPSDLA